MPLMRRIAIVCESAAFGPWCAAYRSVSTCVATLGCNQLSTSTRNVERHVQKLWSNTFNTATPDAASFGHWDRTVVPLLRRCGHGHTLLPASPLSKPQLMSSLLCSQALNLPRGVALLHSLAVKSSGSWYTEPCTTNPRTLLLCLARAEVKPRMSNFPSPLALYDDMSTPEVILDCVHLDGL